MDEKALSEWKEAHADVYSKFKQDLEEQLLKPYGASQKFEVCWWFSFV